MERHAAFDEVKYPKFWQILRKHQNLAGRPLKPGVIRQKIKHYMSEEYYPSWLAQYLMEDLFPWDQARDLSFKEFQQKYTLHDSYWIGLFYNVGFSQDAILSIQWDAVWLPDEIKKKSSVVEEWPILIVKLTEVSEISTFGFESVDGAGRTIAESEVEEIENQTILSITDIFNGNVQFTYSGISSFLAMERNKEILSI